MIIEGAISVKSALENERRKINYVLMDAKKKTRDFRYIENLAKEKGVTLKHVRREKIDELASGKTHGGLIAECETRSYQNFKSLDAKSDVFMLDGIEDPFNLGYMMRTLYAFGYRLLILPKRDYSKMEATILKSSAGAFDKLDIVILNDSFKNLVTLKNQYKLMALARSARAKNIFSYVYPKSPKLFIIGGEKRGIEKNILKIVDEELYIEYPSDFKNALNAASALDVMVTVLKMRGL